MRLGFSDFWPDFDDEDNWLVDLLRQRYDIRIQCAPDLLVYSCYGTAYRRYDCRRLLLNWENRGLEFLRM